jgi:metallo-beta-lactamase class B
MRYLFLVLVLILFSTGLFSQDKTIKVSKGLTLTRLNTNTYIHTADNSNGLIYIVNNEAVIISTSSSDSITSELLEYIKTELKAKVIACIADHWHADAMEGIDVLHQQNIATYSHRLTQKIAKNKGLPEPKNTFEDSLVLSVGDKKIVARYFGPSHSADDIVVWLPNEQILFGSCGVKSLNGWVGNIADAHLDEWSTTIQKVKTTYPNAKTVVPGHGKHGDASLLSYTIKLFEPLLGNKPELRLPSPLYPKVDKSIKYRSYTSATINEEKDTVLHKTILINKDTAIIAIESLDSNTTLSEKSIEIKKGSFAILNEERTELRKVFLFKNLLIDFRDGTLGMTIVIKEFVFE